MQGLKLPVLVRSAIRAARRGRGARRVGWAAACAVGCTGVWAQNDPNPYYIGLSETITHNTNINNVADGPSDTSSGTGIVGGFNQSFGRQRVYGSGNITFNRYREFTQLNNTSYGLNAGLDWQTIGDLSGTVNGSVSQGLANLQNNLLQQTQGRNLVRNEQIGTRANWGGNGRITIGGGYGYSRTHYSTPTLLASDSTNQTTDIGAYYHPGETLTLGTALRYTRGESDRAFQLLDGTFVDSRTNGRNIDLSASWRPTAQTGANARVSFTNQDNAAGGEGFSGLTGELGFTYMPTGKVSFNGSLNRDASTNGDFYNTFNGTTNQPTVGLASSSAVSNSVSLGATYLATAKISVTAGASYRRTTQDNNAIVAGYRDTYKNYSLAANWSIRRFWSLGCSVGRVDRSLSGTFNDSYTGNIFSCSTQITLQ